MARKHKKRRGPPPVPPGILAEHKLTDLLAELQVVLATSPLLDHVHKVDALIHEIKPISGLHEPIALQITQRRDYLEKIVTFFEKASGATKGPLLFAEISGRVTPSMAAGLRNALIALWLELPRQTTREYRVLVLSTGVYEWLPPLPDENRERLVVHLRSPRIQRKRSRT